MVTRTSPTPRPSKARRGTLTKKLFRDMQRSAMQFLAMLLLCALGTWVFTGLDANWRLLEKSSETYFTEYNLSDLWVKGAGFTKQDLTRLEHMEGVSAILPRSSLTVDAPDLGSDVTMAMNAYDGPMTINIPLIRQGEELAPSDQRGCLVEEQFAQYHGLNVGDKLTLDIAGQRKQFVIRGIVLSPEYILTAKDTSPDPAHYGFVLISSQAVQELPFNDVLIDLEEGADGEAVEAAIRDAFPAAMIINQKNHAPTVTARNYVQMFRNLSYLFPVLAYAVAAMIVVSTLSRMMENQRIQMGTLKALGFRDGQIRNHYLCYALVPSLAGSLLGTIVGQYTIPDVLWPMVCLNLRYPAQLRAPISPLSWGIALLTVVLCVLICLFTYRKSARETTASLLRPKPPKSGVRILLERITFFWKRCSFNTKMIIRNLMRNKGRTCLSLVGLICCNMLIICTFGLQESITYFVNEYYNGTMNYEVRVDFEAQQAGTLESYQHRLQAESIDGIMEQSISLRSATQSRTVLLTVLPENQTSMLLGEGHVLLDMPDTGLVISRKLAETMDVALGDTMELWLTGDTEPLYLTVHAFADTNIGQGAFMSRHAWEACRKGDFAVTALLMRGVPDATMHRLENMDEVSGFKYPEKQFQSTMRIMESTKMAFSLLSGAALGLAFIICYNMGLLNFTERTRDYATLKVLGYHQKEIRSLMMRENNYIAILGVLIGIPPGDWLVRAILKMCEYESMVFAVKVSWTSMLLASIITFTFSCMIEGLLTRKVRTIDMVEALKSVE
ncbi:MAG: ABC transporter permease [Aristaeellaceae bacterium]